jgi:uncharacterized membrane protein (DUF106 family)
MMKKQTQLLLFPVLAIGIAMLYQRGFFAFLNPVWDFLLGWTLQYPAIAVVLGLSLVLTLISMIALKYTTDQDLMKRLKEEQKALSQEMKTLQNHPEKMAEVQTRAMETNMEYMSQSFKPLIFTMLPLVLIMGWFSAHLAFVAIAPAQEFSATLAFNAGTNGTVNVDAPYGVDLTSDGTKAISDSVKFTFKGTEGKHTITFTTPEQEYPVDVVVTNGKEYVNPITLPKTGPVRSITIDLQKLIILNLFGWKIGWFGSYFIFSIIFSMVLRKLLNVY